MLETGNLFGERGRVFTHTVFTVLVLDPGVLGHLFLHSGHPLAELRTQRHDACLQDVLVPQLDEFLEPRGHLLGQVVDLARIGGQVVQLPLLGALGLGDEDNLTVTLVDRRTAASLLALDELLVVDALGLAGQEGDYGLAAHGHDLACYDEIRRVSVQHKITSPPLMIKFPSQLSQRIVCTGARFT